MQFKAIFHSWHDRVLNRLFIRKFDLFIFETEADYNCYVKATNTLIESNVRLSCDFLSNRTIFHQGIYHKDLDHIDLLNRKSLNKQYNLVIDNTPWPEALNNTSVYSPLSVKLIRDSRKQDLDVMFSMQMNYVETSLHYRMV